MKGPLVMLAACLLWLSPSAALSGGSPVIVFENDPEVELGIDGSVLIQSDGQRALISLSVVPEDWPPCGPGGDPEACCEDIQVEVVEFQASPAEVAPGGAVTMDWFGRGAYECTGQGDIPDWNGRTVYPNSNGATPAQRVAFVPTTAEPGPVELSIRCRNGLCSRQSASVTLIISP